MTAYNSVKLNNALRTEYDLLLLFGVGKQRSPGQTVTALSLPETLKDAIDQRAAQLGLSRSAYLCALARADIATGGPLTIEAATLHDAPSEPSSKPPPPAEPARIADKVLRYRVAAARRSDRKSKP